MLSFDESQLHTTRFDAIENGTLVSHLPLFPSYGSKSNARILTAIITERLMLSRYIYYFGTYSNVNSLATLFTIAYFHSKDSLLKEKKNFFIEL